MWLILDEQPAPAGEFTEAAKAFFVAQMQLLKDRGAEGIILGCTELPMLIDSQDFELPMMATTQLHAQMAADFILVPHPANSA